MAKLTELKDERFNLPWEPWQDKMIAEDDALAEYGRKSDALPDNVLIGHVIRFGVGDGYAYYLVTKESPLTLAWIPYGDRWQVENALIRGLNKSDILADREGLKQLRSYLGGKTCPSGVFSVQEGDTGEVCKCGALDAEQIPPLDGWVELTDDEFTPEKEQEALKKKEDWHNRKRIKAEELYKEMNK